MHLTPENRGGPSFGPVPSGQPVPVQAAASPIPIAEKKPGYASTPVGWQKTTLRTESGSRPTMKLFVG